MTEPDPLNRKIDDLMDWQSVAWQRIADPYCTVFERREIRNHMKECDLELRKCLRKMSERVWNTGSMTDVGNCLANIKFRLFA